MTAEGLMSKVAKLTDLAKAFLFVMAWSVFHVIASLVAAARISTQGSNSLVFAVVWIMFLIAAYDIVAYVIFGGKIVCVGKVSRLQVGFLIGCAFMISQLLFMISVLYIGLGRESDSSESSEAYKFYGAVSLISSIVFLVWAFILSYNRVHINQGLGLGLGLMTNVHIGYSSTRDDDISLQILTSKTINERTLQKLATFAALSINKHRPLSSVADRETINYMAAQLQRHQCSVTVNDAAYVVLKEMLIVFRVAHAQIAFNKVNRMEVLLFKEAVALQKNMRFSQPHCASSLTKFIDDERSLRHVCSFLSEHFNYYSCNSSTVMTIQTDFEASAMHDNFDKLIFDLQSCKLHINAVGKYGHTALSIAALRGNMKLVNTFISMGADTDCQTKLGEAALHFASMKNHVPIVERLLRCVMYLIHILT